MVESDEEQVEVLKDWWKENGTSLMVIVVLSLGGNFGYRAWETNVRETGEAASAVYEDLLIAANAIEPGSEDTAMVTTANTLAETLKNDHADSTYALFGAMHLVRIAVDNDDLETAQSELEWVLENVADQHLETIARMRLARVLVAKGESELALSVLKDHQPSPGQRASWEEVHGDVHIAMGDQDSARNAYQRAINNLVEDVNKPLLEIKLADIPLADTPRVEELPIAADETVETTEESVTGDDA